jgi:hypothetical protein
MAFLYPTFLWALGVLAIPVIVHLFNFRRTKKIYFSNTRFIQQVQEATSAKRRLKHLLVLASRLLFLFFLVLVFAQPIIPAREQLKAGENIALYLDNSQSMACPVQGGQRAIDAGIATAQSIVENFPPGTRYRLLTNDFPPFSNSLKTKSEVLDILSQIRLSGAGRSAAEVKARLQRLGGEREVFWISDFQKSTVGSTPLADTVRNWHLVPLISTTRSNIFVDTAFLSNPFAIGGERNTLVVKLFNDGDEQREQLTARLVLDGLQAGTTSVTIPANSFGEVGFDLQGNATGYHQAMISFSDAPVTFDNEFFVVFNFSKRINVLEIKGNSTATVVEKVFGNKALFQFNSVNSRNIEYNKIQQSDLVIVNELAQLDGPLVQALQEFRENAGSILLIPSALPNIDSYQKLLSTIQLSKQATLLSLAKPDFSNPFFANVFQERSAALAMPFVRNSIEWGADRQALLRQQDDTPYLSVFKGSGKLYVIGSLFQESFGSFFNNALFVPVMYRIAAFSRDQQQPLYYLLSQREISLRSDSIDANQLITLTGKQELIPSQRIVNQQVQFDLSGLELQQGHAVLKNNKDTLAWLAFNQAKEESKLRALTGEELLSVFGKNTTIYTVNTESTAAMNEAIKQNYQGKALWKYALLLALLFVAVEIVLLRFWK